MKKPQIPDKRNKYIKIYIDGVLYSRDEAKISVFDSTVQGGDAVWEGIRVYKGGIFMLNDHLNRLIDSAKAMHFDKIPSKESINNAIIKTLKANKMTDEVHLRLTLSRGKKVTSGMSPEWNQYGCSLIVLAEWKKPVYNKNGIKLITSSIRRNTSQCIDSKIHHNNLINNILAKIQANNADVDDAVMLDVEGYVSETNATNIFIVKDKVLYTPFADSCLPGITRKCVINIAKENNIPFKEKRISISELYTADEMFVTGSMGELTKIIEIDKRKLFFTENSSFFKKISVYFNNLTKKRSFLTKI